MNLSDYTKRKVCRHCDTDMTDWPRKDDDGISLVWDIVTDGGNVAADYTHLYWSCNECHSNGVNFA